MQKAKEQETNLEKENPGTWEHEERKSMISGKPMIIAKEPKNSEAMEQVAKDTNKLENAEHYGLLFKS